MKTHPSQRKFGLPVAIVASAHAILFLGFRAPHPLPTGTGKTNVTPPEKRVVEIVQPPVVETNSEENPNAKSTSGGDPLPTTEDRPSVSNDPTSIVIPVETRVFTPVAGPINIIPVTPGDPTGTPHIPNVGGLDFVPHALSRMSPVYPASMKSIGVTGSVTVMFTVDESGRVAEASVVSATRSEFEDAALRAIFHWRFEPGKRHGRPTAFRMSIPLNFVLEQ